EDAHHTLRTGAWRNACSLAVKALRSSGYVRIETAHPLGENDNIPCFISSSIKPLMRLLGALRLLLPGVQHRRADTVHRGLASGMAEVRTAHAVLMSQL